MIPCYLNSQLELIQNSLDCLLIEIYDNMAFCKKKIEKLVFFKEVKDGLRNKDTLAVGDLVRQEKDF